MHFDGFEMVFQQNQTNDKRRGFVLAVILAPLIGITAFQSPASDEQRITVNKDYSSQRYVDLDQITPANVGRLKEVSEINLNVPAWFNSGMLMVGRTIYANTLGSTFATDAATCDLRWRYDIQFRFLPQTNSNRGPAYLDGMVFRGTGDGTLKNLKGRPDPTRPSPGANRLSNARRITGFQGPCDVEALDKRLLN